MEHAIPRSALALSLTRISFISALVFCFWPTLTAYLGGGRAIVPLVTHDTTDG